jgi:hypothetical protein
MTMAKAMKATMATKTVDAVNGLAVELIETRWPGLTAMVTQICQQTPVSEGTTAVAKKLVLLMPQLSFRDVLTRGGWYRLGGVVDVHGDKIVDDLAEWAEAELAAHDDDLHALVEDYANSGCKVTRINGKTHYLVASTGALATDFVQIEIEELQEGISHDLFAEDDVPGSLEELIDPPRDKVKNATSKALNSPLGAPVYVLRRITDMADFVGRMRMQRPEPQIVHRFFDAWQSSSASYTTQFSNHWAVAVREYIDRYHQAILQATPVAAFNGLPPRFNSTLAPQGLSLHEALQHFDRQVGYPMAWFFHMLTTKVVPHAVANAVIDDVQNGFSYLPERDVKVVKDWLHRPYSF